MRKGKLIGALLFSALALVGVSAAGKSANAAVKQEINVSTSGEIDTLDAVDSIDINSSDTIGQVTEGLYRIGTDGQAELGLAKAKPVVSKDGLTYTFKLRQTTWSNGDKLTANDFVYAFQKTVDPAEGSGSADQLDIFKNAEKIRKGELDKSALGVKAVDDYTLEITLENPISYLPQVLVGTHFIPQDKTFAEKLGKDFGSSSAQYVGNGPFTITGWDGTNESWTLKKNTSYWDAKNVKLSKINVQVVKEVATGVKLFDDDQLDYTTLSDVYVAQRANDKEAHTQSKALVGYISANEKRTVTGNKYVRQALLQAINKKAYAKNILADGSTALNGYVPKDLAKNPDTGEDFRSENGNLLAYNLKKAKAAWKTAKKELGKDKITLELLSADTAAAKKSVEFLQGQLEQNLPGLTINVKSMPLNSRLALQSSGDFDLVFATWTGDYSDPYDFLKNYSATGGINTSGYASTSYDQKLTAAQGTLANDPTKRWDKLLAAEKQLVQTDTAVLPLYQGATAYLQSSKVKGIQVLSIGRSVSFRQAYVTK